MRLFARILLFLVVAVVSRGLLAEESEWEVVPSGTVTKPFGNGPPEQMMANKLKQEVRAARARWKQAYEERATPEAIRKYQQELKQKFRDAIGPLPSHTPLKPELVRRIDKPGYRVETIMFQSQPDHHVTALLFLPDKKRFPPPYPGVIIPCGHATEGKANGGYQKGAALLALNGMAGLVFDPIGQGERMQLLEPNGKHKFHGTREHTMVGVGSILLGENTARFMIWDGMRALDYLQSRDDIMPDKLGCMGNSGGGAQTSYLMALDERIVAAAPSCYLTNFERLIETIGAQDAEQNIFGQLKFGMDHADYVIMRAPRPTLICAVTQDFFDIDGTWKTYRDAKRVYTRLGAPENVDLVEVDAKHGWHQPLREASVRWMARWLLDKRIDAKEPNDLEILSAKEARCSPQGQVMLMKAQRSIYDINRARAGSLEYLRSQKKYLDNANELKEVCRKVVELPEWAQVKTTRVFMKNGRHQADDFSYRRIVLESEPGIFLPGRVYQPTKPAQDPPVLLVDSDAESAANRAVELAQAGRAVLVVDLRGFGQTRQSKQTYGAPHFGRDVQDFYAAYLLGKSFVGMRAFDTAVATKWLSEQHGKGGPVELIAIDRACVPALHAAVAYPDHYSKVILVRPLTSWSSIVESGESMNRIMDTVHGGLSHYDLPALVKSLGDKVEIESPRGPLDANGKP